MDWNIFWNAFGAIGSTIGSVVTAIAVVVAVNQYRQPLRKRLKIGFDACTAGKELELFLIRISNNGVRPVNVANVYLRIGKQNLPLRSVQFLLPNSIIKFPVDLQPEQSIELKIDKAKLSEFLRSTLKAGTSKQTMKVKVAVLDKSGDWYCCKTGSSVKDLTSL